MRYNIGMKRFWEKKRSVGYLLFTVVLLSLFSWFLVSFPPEALFHYVVFYVLLFGLCMTFGMYVFADALPSAVASVGVVIYFLLRSFNLRHPVYGILLVICCLSVLRLFSPSSDQRTRT